MAKAKRSGDRKYKDPFTNKDIRKAQVKQHNENYVAESTKFTRAIEEGIARAPAPTA